MKRWRSRVRLGDNTGRLDSQLSKGHPALLGSSEEPRQASSFSFNMFGGQHPELEGVVLAEFVRGDCGALECGSLLPLSLRPACWPLSRCAVAWEAKPRANAARCPLNGDHMFATPLFFYIF